MSDACQLLEFLRLLPLEALRRGARAQWGRVVAGVFAHLERCIRAAHIDWDAVADLLEGEWRRFCQKAVQEEAAESLWEQYQWLEDLLRLGQQVQLWPEGAPGQGGASRNVSALDPNDLTLRLLLRARQQLGGRRVAVPIAVLPPDRSLGMRASLVVDLIEDFGPNRPSRLIFPHPGDRYSAKYDRAWTDAAMRAWAWALPAPPGEEVDAVYRVVSGEGALLSPVEGPSASGALFYALRSLFTRRSWCHRSLILAQVGSGPDDRSGRHFALEPVERIYEKVLGYLIDGPIDIDLIAIPHLDNIPPVQAALREAAGRRETDLDALRYLELQLVNRDGSLGEVVPMRW